MLLLFDKNGKFTILKYCCCVMIKIMKTAHVWAVTNKNKL